jgi:hypothetical protein
MTLGLVLLAEEVNELPAPAWVFGLVAFALLIGLLLVTLAIGKGRRHS